MIIFSSKQVDIEIWTRAPVTRLRRCNLASNPMPSSWTTPRWRSLVYKLCGHVKCSYVYGLCAALG